MKVSNYLEYINLHENLLVKINNQNELIFFPNPKINSIIMWINNNLGLSSFIFSSLINTVYLTGYTLHNYIKINAILNPKNMIENMTTINCLIDNVNKYYYIISNTLKVIRLFLENIDKKFNTNLTINFFTHNKLFDFYTQNIVHDINIIHTKVNKLFGK